MQGNEEIINLFSAAFVLKGVLLNRQERVLFKQLGRKNREVQTITIVKQTKLFDQFSPVTTKEWLDKINDDLKGADFNRKLVRRTNEGFDVKPFYRREDLDKINYLMDLIPFLRMETGVMESTVRETHTDNNWLIRQNIEVTDFSASNVKALSLTGRGVDSVGFVIADPESVSDQNLMTLLKKINPNDVEINFLSNGKAREIISLLVEFCDRNGYDLSSLHGCIEADPLGRLMMNGTLCIPVKDGLDYLAGLTNDALALPRYRNLQINGSGFSDAGSDSVQELAFSISMAVEYLSALTDRGISAEDAARKIRFSFGIGSDYFMEISKLRAARILWSVISEGYGLEGDDSFRMEMHCVTSKWNSTIYDPYVNLLRTQTEAMSAVIGGTDSLTVNPFDIACSRPGEFSERIARNQQLIMKEEAYLGKVADPASGSYYIENLTALIAENSWKLFLETEAKGGFLAALESGFVRKKITESYNSRIEDIENRKEVLVGTNKYPDFNEKLSDDAAPVFRQDAEKNTKGQIIEPFNFQRGSEEIEKIRIAVDRTPRRPKVFMFTIGNIVSARARSQFSAGFFGCAGYEVIGNECFSSVSEGTDAALKSAADIVVICSSDGEYREFAPEIFRMLNGKTIVVIAGSPENIDELKACGIENFISLKSNLYETLRFYNSLLGIK